MRKGNLFILLLAVTMGGIAAYMARSWIAEHANIPALALPYTVGGNDQAKDLFSLYDNTLSLMLGALKK